MIIFYLSDNLLEVDGLHKEIDGSYVNAATVTVTLKDAAGEDVADLDGAGVVWPLVLAYVVASNGRYNCILPDTLDITPMSAIMAIIDADGGPGLHKHWEMPLVVRVDAD
jgi:hypothetical protein